MQRDFADIAQPAESTGLPPVPLYGIPNNGTGRAGALQNSWLVVGLLQINYVLCTS